ncbi:MAG: hypothetical protein HYZ42_02535 [Bacteroidetes bacterium]|nr:hypothetical protein [Bacteroidota bacterium]
MKNIFITIALLTVVFFSSAFSNKLNPNEHYQPQLLDFYDFNEGCVHYRQTITVVYFYLPGMCKEIGQRYCLNGINLMNKLNTKYANKGIRFVGLNLGNNNKVWQEAMDELKPNFLQVQTADDRFDRTFKKNFPRIGSGQFYLISMNRKERPLLIREANKYLDESIEKMWNDEPNKISIEQSFHQ